MKDQNYNRREFLGIISAGTLSFGISGLMSTQQVFCENKEKTKPNFIIIFTDDQGYQDVGCFGSPNIRTPYLDKMAAEGMRFTDFYVGASICSPSRAALMTGCYPPRIGITKVLFPYHNIGLSPKEITIADILKEQGYATACIGKWHLGHLPQFLPTSNGFDYYYGIPYSNDMDAVKGKDTNLDKAWENRDYSPWNVPLMQNEKIIERPAVQTTLIERYTKQAISFIQNNKDRPFFLYLPHTMPHIPLFVSEKFHLEDPKMAYKTTIEQIDYSIGQVLKTVRDTGLDNNTLIIFTSDNGPWLEKKNHAGSALPLRDGKFSTYEGGMREPCIMRWPGTIPAGSICSEVCATIDLLPTIAKLAGSSEPQDRVIDGKDIFLLMSGTVGARSPHDAYFYYNDEKLEAVRSGRWKLIRKEPIELYDLETDISEKNNLAKEHPSIVEQLIKIMNEFDKELKENSRPAGSVN
jgi:arylsulfatase A